MKANFSVFEKARVLLVSTAAIFSASSAMAQVPGAATVPVAEIGDIGVRGSVSAGMEYVRLDDLRLIVGVNVSYQNNEGRDRIEYFLVRGGVGFGAPQGARPWDQPTGPFSYADISVTPYSRLSGMTPSEARSFLRSRTGTVALVQTALRGPTFQALTDQRSSSLVRAQAFLVGFDVSAQFGNARSLLNNQGVRGFVNLSLGALAGGFAHTRTYGAGLTYSLGRVQGNVGMDVMPNQDFTLRFSAGGAADTLSGTNAFSRSNGAHLVQQYNAYARIEALFNMSVFQGGVYAEAGVRGALGIDQEPGQNYAYGTVGLELITNR